MKKTIFSNIILYAVILLPYLGMMSIFIWYNNKAKKIENATFVVVSKQDLSLTVLDYKGEELCKYPIAVGKNYGNKQKVGDMKTPEGMFKVSDIQNSSSWTHDFNDGNGEISGAYGPFFIRLYVPGHKGIGIHGTHDPSSILKRVTEGCIRMNNEDILKVVPLIHKGTTVIISTSQKDVTENLTKNENL